MSQLPDFIKNMDTLFSENFPGVVTQSSGNHGQAVAWASSPGKL